MRDLWLAVIVALTVIGAALVTHGIVMYRDHREA
jgi:hypothetical protein